MKFVFAAILIFFAIIGISHIVFSVFYHFIKLKDDNAVILVIPDITKNTDVEFVLRSLAFRVKKLGNCGINQIVCIDNGFDKKTARECELVCKDYDYITIMTNEEFKQKAGL